MVPALVAQVTAVFVVPVTDAENCTGVPICVAAGEGVIVTAIVAGGVTGAVVLAVTPDPHPISKNASARTKTTIEIEEPNDFLILSSLPFAPYENKHAQ